MTSRTGVEQPARPRQELAVLAAEQDVGGLSDERLEQPLALRVGDLLVLVPVRRAG